MAQHARRKIDAGGQVDLCDPHSPWQRGGNELEHQRAAAPVFPKGTDLAWTVPRRLPLWRLPSTRGPARPSIGKTPDRRLISW